MRPEEVRDTVMAMREDAYQVMTGQPAPPLIVICPDGGTCHHGCHSECFRVATCSPLTGVFPDDRWPVEVRPAPVPTLGCRVAFDYADIIYRQQVKPDMFKHPIREQFRKEWRKTEWVKRGNHRYGVLVGIRTLSNGTIDWSFDEPVTFYPETYFTGYIVAFDLRRKPVHLLPADVEILP